ncbi:MAG: hypothetical protein IKM03_00445 [Alistipes sp.]|nr:hypothetical protein [Alistipes sp.]
MKRIFISIITFIAILFSALGHNAMAQSKLSLSAEGITFYEESSSNIQVSPIVNINKKALTIGGLASSSIPSFELGWNMLSKVDYSLYDGMDAGKFMNIREWKSTQFTINLLGVGAYSSNKKIGFSAAIGIRANNYRLGSNTTFVKQEGMLMPASISDLYGNLHIKKSKFNIASIHIPMEVQFGNPRKFAFSVGGYFDMVMNSHTKIKFKGGPKEKIHSFPTNFIQAGATMRMTFYHFSIFCSYQPTPLFKTDCGPKAQQWTIGIGF